MALSQTHRIIWLDAFIGQDNECHSFKRNFCTTLDPDAQFGTEFDVLICALNTNAIPFIFVDTPERAIHEIEINHDKKIIFISSGSLGQHIIPDITSTYFHVYSFYIFCSIVANYIDFAYDYRHCLQIFTSELDLLVRLVRDISEEMIEQGKRHLLEEDPEGALDYFTRSRILEETANKKNTLNGSFLDHLRLLDGYCGKIGCIQEAKDMKKKQDEEREEPQPYPILPEYDSQGQMYGVAYEYPDSPIVEQISQDEESELIGHNPDLPMAEQVSVWNQEEQIDQNSNFPIMEQVLLMEQ